MDGGGGAFGGGGLGDGSGLGSGRVGAWDVEVSGVLDRAAEASVVAGLAAEGWEVVVDSAVGAKTENTP